MKLLFLNACFVTLLCCWATLTDCQVAVESLQVVEPLLHQAHALVGDVADPGWQVVRVGDTLRVTEGVQATEAEQAVRLFGWNQNRNVSPGLMLRYKKKLIIGIFVTLLIIMPKMHPKPVWDRQRNEMSTNQHICLGNSNFISNQDGLVRQVFDGRDNEIV